MQYDPRYCIVQRHIAADLLADLQEPLLAVRLLGRVHRAGRLGLGAVCKLAGRARDEARLRRGASGPPKGAPRAVGSDLRAPGGPPEPARGGRLSSLTDLAVPEPLAPRRDSWACGGGRAEAHRGESSVGSVWTDFQPAFRLRERVALDLRLYS